MNYIFYQNLMSGSSIKCVADNLGNKEIKLSDNNFSSWYNINSISYCVDDVGPVIFLNLHYTFYNYSENRLLLCNKRDTLIAVSEGILDQNSYTLAENELINYGKSLARYMNLKFIILDIGASIKYDSPKVRCVKCDELILTNPLDEDILSKYQLTKDLFKIRKKDYNFLTSNQIKRINDNVIRRLEWYYKNIRNDFYCEDCIQSFYTSFKKSIEEDISIELVKFYKENKPL